MAAGDILTIWDADPTDFPDLTGLASLQSLYVWRSGAITPGLQTPDSVMISYDLTFSTTPAAGNSLRFYFASGDGAASNEVWDAGIANTAGVVSDVAERAAIENLFPVEEKAWKTSHPARFKGSFEIQVPGPAWQLLIQPNGLGLASSGAIVRYRYSYKRVLAS